MPRQSIKSFLYSRYHRLLSCSYGLGSGGDIRARQPRAFCVSVCLPQISVLKIRNKSFTTVRMYILTTVVENFGSSITTCGSSVLLLRPTVRTTIFSVPSNVMNREPTFMLSVAIHALSVTLNATRVLSVSHFSFFCDPILTE